LGIVGTQGTKGLMKVSTNWRAWLAFGHDVIAAALAWIGLYWLRYNLELHEPQLSDMLQTLAWVLPLQAGIFLAFGLYRGLWRFASLPDLQRIVLAVGLGAVAVPVVLVMLRLTSVVPRSVLILYPPVLIMLMAGSRFTYRVWKEHRLYSPLAALGEPVLILGAGEAGAQP
jgi:FlaA1/EpsC-like NDP-sugar epimerase